MFSKKCKAHLKEVNETALQHMWYAVVIAAKLQLLVLVLLIHAVVPRLFTKTASTTMRNILDNR